MSCAHDWYTIEDGPHVRSITRQGLNKWVKEGWWVESAKYSHHLAYQEGFEVSWRAVCLICGECIDTITEAEEQIKRRALARDERAELAKKLWAACMGEVEG